MDLRFASWSKCKTIIMLIAAIVVCANLVSTIAFKQTSVYGTTLSAVAESTPVNSVACNSLQQEFKAEYPRLETLDIFFSVGGQEEQDNAVLVEIFKDEELLFNNKIPASSIVSNAWNTVFVNMPLEKNASYTLRFTDTNPDETGLRVGTGDASSGAFGSFQSGKRIEESLAVRYGFMAPLGKIDKVALVLGNLGLLVIVFVVLRCSARISACCKRILCAIKACSESKIVLGVVQALLGAYIASCSGIELRPETTVVLLGLSFFSGFFALKSWGSFQQNVHTKIRRMLLIVLYLYAAFALVGQRLFIYPLTMDPGWRSAFSYFIAFIWSIPIMNLLLYLFNWVSAKFVEGSVTPYGSLKFSLICVFLLCTPAAVFLVAVNPGITSPDTYTTLVGAHHLHGVEDWHPAFYYMLLRAIIAVCDSTYAVIAVQYLFWAAVLLNFFLFLKRRGMSPWLLMAFAFLMGANASNYFHLDTIWKDVPYAIALVWAFVAFLKIVVDDKERNRWLPYIELALAAVLVCLLRKNGFVTAGAIVLLALLVNLKRPKAWGCAVLSLLLVCCVKGPVYSSFQIQDTGNKAAFIGLGQDILGVYYSGGSVSQETLDVVMELQGSRIDPILYWPTWASAESLDMNISYGEFIGAYFNTFIRNPSLMTRAMIARGDAAWSIFSGKDTILNLVGYSDTADGYEDWNDYYPNRKPLEISSFLEAEMQPSEESQILDIIEWRGGLSVLVALGAMASLVLRGVPRRYLLLITPLAAQILSLAMSTGWSDFRYFWPLTLLSACFAISSLLLAPSRSRAKCWCSGRFS